MSVFTNELSARLARSSAPGEQARRWIFVPYDQLTDAVGPLATTPPESLGIVLVETRWKARQRRYHKQKLALVLSNLRQFALEQASRGVAVRHVVGDDCYAKCLEPIIADLGPLEMMEAAERELRQDLANLVQAGSIRVLPNSLWLTRREQFEAAFAGDRPWRMDRFYRQVRRDFDILMEAGKPAGGKFSFDTENRKRWPHDPPAPEPPMFAMDPIKREIVEIVEDEFGDHPGRLDASRLPTTREDAESAWSWALDECLPLFGPFEDAMSVASQSLFHTRISALMNLGRLTPRRVLDDALGRDIPLASKEGFVRQILGWREFMRHIHVATDGFRTLAADGRPNFLAAREPLPPAFWGSTSGLRCLDHVVADVWETGYGHHITRLMILSNLATLLGVEPRELSDWFWIAYIDAYDWVVEPNVLGMGTFALGDLFVTKPYVSGAAYIHKMSDYCQDCAFSPRKNCPITPMYWAFFGRHEEPLGKNPRVAMALRSAARRDPDQRRRDKDVLDWVRSTLREGRALRPEDMPG